MTRKQKERIQLLFYKYVENQVTEEEKADLFELLREVGSDEEWVNIMEEVFALESPMKDYRREDWQPFIDSVARKQTRMVPLRRILVAASLAGLVIAGYFLMNRNKEKPSIVFHQYKGDVLPGHSGAVLHLSNGDSLFLDSVSNGLVASQGNIKAVKIDGELVYSGKTSETLYNTVSTNRGRQWKLTLPDGTKVWLNAASSITYPLAFNAGERKVEVSGEVYFEVAHLANQPFIVKAADQTIQDIGTSFNVNVYPDEPAAQTTLIEGSIAVNGILLKPAQTVSFTNGEADIHYTDTEQVMAWKNGLFSFKNADIHEVMKQLARWYDVEVVYEGKADPTPFRGEIGRNLTLAQVLKILETVHVHFRIEEDKRIVILP